MSKVVKYYYYAYMNIEKSYIEIASLKECFTKTEKMDIESFINFCNTAKKNTVIFINNLNIVAHFMPGGEIDGFKQLKDGEHVEIIKYTYKNCLIKSFSVLKPANTSMQNLMAIYKAPNICAAMHEYICDLGGAEKMEKVRTLAARAKTLFYEDIKMTLWAYKKKKKIYVNKPEEWLRCYAGVKCGIFTQTDELKIYEDVDCWDLKSAYSSIIINDRFFPIGKPRFTENRVKFCEMFFRNEWVKMIADGNVMDEYYDEKVDKTALEFYDIHQLILLRGKQFFIDLLNNNKWIMMFSDETGYIHDCIREKTIELYNQKNVMSKTDPKREIVKAQLECVYGKTIQWREVEEGKDVLQQYKGRGENFLLPIHGNHMSAALRYIMTKIWIDLYDDVLYIDTDGLKVRHNKRTVEYFNKFNENILRVNHEAGFDSDIGTFDMEGHFERLCVIGTKMYCIQNGDDIELTCAGMDALAKEYCISVTKYNSGSTDKVFECWRDHGFPFFSKVVTYDENTKKFDISYNDTLIKN